MSKNITQEGRILEERIIEELMRFNIKGNREFKLPSVKGSEFRVDFFINFPIRGVVEFKTVSSPPGSGIIKQITHISKHFKGIHKRQSSGTFHFFLVLISNFDDSSDIRRDMELIGDDFPDLPLSIIFVPKKEKNKALFCAQKIRNIIVHAPKFRITEIPKSQNIEQFEDVLISLIPWVNLDEEAAIINEVAELNSEINSEHFVSAALRIGRTLEYIIYTLAQSLGININRISLKLINDLNNSNSALKKIIIDYLYADLDDREKKKAILKEKCDEMSSKIIAIGSKTDDELGKQKETDTPVYLYSLLRGIQKEFSHLDEVKVITENLIKGESMSYLRKMRNSAAHARILKRQKDVTKKEIDSMIEHLNIIIFELVSISTLANQNKT